jgi:hypothetical protein
MLHGVVGMLALVIGLVMVSIIAAATWGIWKPPRAPSAARPFWPMHEPGRRRRRLLKYSIFSISYGQRRTAAK